MGIGPHLVCRPEKLKFLYFFQKITNSTFLAYILNVALEIFLILCDAANTLAT